MVRFTRRTSGLNGPDAALGHTPAAGGGAGSVERRDAGGGSPRGAGAVVPRSATGARRLNRRSRQPPFAIRVLRPDDLRVNERNFLDHQAAREKSEPNRTRNRKASACKKLPGTVSFACGMVMPVSFRPHHGVTLMRRICTRRAEPLAQLLLNPRLCAPRLHIQVHRQERDGEEGDERTGAKKRKAGDFFHSETLRCDEFEEKTKGLRHAS